MTPNVPQEQPSDTKPVKKTKWYWNVFYAILMLWCFGGINVLLLRDIPLLLFLLGWGFALFYPTTVWLKPQGPPGSRQRLIGGLYCMLWGWFVIAVVLALLLFVIPPFAISPQTTYLTEPRSKEFYGIDYAAVIEKQLDLGVSPEENGFRLLTEKLGHTFYGGNFADEQWHHLCRYLELPTDIEPQHTFVDWRTYEKTLTPEEKEIVEKSLDKSMLYPFSEEAMPEEAMPIVRRWLNENNSVLDLFAVAAQKPVLYIPPMFDGILIGTNFINDCTCREMAKHLHIRIRYRLTVGEIDKAWDDVLTIYRLGEQQRRAVWNMTSSLLNSVIVGIANRSAESVLIHSGWSTDVTLRKAGEILPFMRPFSDDEIRGVLRNERLTVLDAFQNFANGTYGLCMCGVIGVKLTAQNDWKYLNRKIVMRFVRMKNAMIAMNRHCDEMERQYFNDGPLLNGEGMIFGHELHGSMYDLLKTFAWHGLSGTISGLVGQITTAMLTNEVKILRTNFKTRQTNAALLRLLFALEAHKRDNDGRYPDALDELRGRYIDEIPLDPFSGEAFRYIVEPAGVSFLLYSVGPNGLDEEGRDPNDTTKSDDIHRRMPYPLQNLPHSEPAV